MKFYLALFLNIIKSLHHDQNQLTVNKNFDDYIQTSLENKLLFDGQEILS
jgi:hypothetical protein